MNLKKFLLIVYVILGLSNCIDTETIGWIDVRSTPQGLEVIMDDSLTGFQTNCILENVPPGEHIIRLEYPGYISVADTVNVQEGDTALVEAKLKIDSTGLSVQSEPRGATIWIDGTDSGRKTNYFFTSLSEGSHNIHLVLDGYIDADTSVVLVKGETKTVKLNLRPDQGAISIKSTPEKASIYLNDSLTGRTTNVTFASLKPGTYTIKLVLENYLDYYTTVEVKTDDTAEVQANLDNRKLWSFNTAGIVESSPAIADDGTVYVTSLSNSTYALNQGGNIKWSYATGLFIQSSPAVASDGTIYFGSCDNYIYSIDPSGALEWRYGSSTDISTSPAIGVDGTIYIGASARRIVTLEMVDYLYALNPDSTMKWAFEIGEEDMTKVTASPCIAVDGTILFGCQDEYIYALTPQGSLKWRFKAQGALNSSPAIDGQGNIYFGCDDGCLYALTSDGVKKWSYETGGSILGSPAIGVDGTVYFGSNDSFLYALSSSGELKWRYSTQSPIQSSVTLGLDGIVYFGSTEGYVYAVGSNGELCWRYKTGGSVKSSPAIAPDGTLIVGSSDGLLYALRCTSNGLALSPWPRFHHDNGNTGRAN